MVRLAFNVGDRVTLFRVHDPELDVDWKDTWVPGMYGYLGHNATVIRFIPSNGSICVKFDGEGDTLLTQFYNWPPGCFSPYFAPPAKVIIDPEPFQF